MQVFSTADSVCANSPGYQGEAVVRSSRHLAAFSARLEHVGPQRGAVRGDLSDGDDQFPVQSHQRVELLDDLHTHTHIMVAEKK